MADGKRLYYRLSAISYSPSAISQLATRHS